MEMAVGCDVGAGDMRMREVTTPFLLGFMGIRLKEKCEVTEKRKK